jgi:hypothetical protein
MTLSKRGITPTEIAFTDQHFIFSHQGYPLKLTQTEYHLCHFGVQLWDISGFVAPNQSSTHSPDYSPSSGEAVPT